MSENGLAKIGGMTEVERAALCERAKTLLAEAKTVAEVKEMRDQAATMAAYLS